jgi:16S rRNA C967 or C1407 C5-methylase (RsmB/RsmF family)
MYREAAQERPAMYLEAAQGPATQREAAQWVEKEILHPGEQLVVEATFLVPPQAVAASTAVEAAASMAVEAAASMVVEAAATGVVAAATGVAAAAGGKSALL